MRRRDKEITDRSEMLEIVRRAEVCRLGMCDGNVPYIVPMSFGIDGDRIYLHSATEGRKLDIIRRNPNVCGEFDCDVETVRGERGCNFGAKYRSVIGFGTACVVEDRDEVLRGLDTLVLHYGGEPGGYSDEMLGKTAVIRADVTSITGKKSGF